MKKLGKRNNGMRDSTVVARGCFCGYICTCYGAPSASAAYTTAQAAGWMVTELIA